MKTEATVYFLFDELFSEEKKTQPINFCRNTTANVVKWKLKKGSYNLLTFEPYSLQYLQIIIFGDSEVHAAKVIEFANPDTDVFRFQVYDERIQKILEAARETFRQNAVDLLTDCPSRERAGWLSDSYFTSEAERLFTGKNLVEDAFLENYAFCQEPKLPQGMIPMCYPSDSYDATFIPNWAMWYILEIHKHFLQYGKDWICHEARPNVLGIVEYFRNKENEFELLEDLNSWIFVEWSAANDADHICGVNFPTNMCWFRCLKCVAEMYDLPSLSEKADRIREKICALGFDGEFFVDNCLRAKDGRLVQTGLKTEVCQYYAFWFGVVTRESHGFLWEMLKSKFGPRRKQGSYPEIARPNAMYGIYMRLDLLMREGNLLQLKEECISYFEPMAEKTGTLWEHHQPSASFVHGFASYAARWLVYVCTGWNGRTFEDKYLGEVCTFDLPQSDAILHVEIKDGHRKVKCELKFGQKFN